MNLSKGAKALVAQVTAPMTQTELAAQLGISRAAVCDWCAGKAKPKARYRKRLKKILGITETEWDEA